jgi:hypothetical protein
MEAEGIDRETISQDIYDTITLPARRFKEAISARIIHFGEFMQQYAGDPTAYSSFTSSSASLDII